LSGFAVIFERTDTPVDPEVLTRVMARLNHRGPDGCDEITAGNVCMGHWHFWTTPEEVGERQPLELNGLPFRIVLDGRLDNRAELFSKLNIDPMEGGGFTDAALVLLAYDRWKEHCFDHFIGEYALVIFDERRNELICARDALGGRTLFHASYGRLFVIASEPWAAAGADGASPELNESAAAHYFALKAPEDGQTLFDNVYELLPAHVMTVDPSNQRIERYWRPDPFKRVRYKTDAEYAEHFLSLLEESVRCRLRSNTPAGVMMSGGLDSTSVACLAARMMKPEPLTAISYVFDELKDCDERPYIEAVKERWDIRSIQIPCDDAWPYKDWQSWPHDPNRPEDSLYRLLKERVYKCARAQGFRVLLTGDFGDHLYLAGKDWLVDLLFDGRLLDAEREWLHHVRTFGPRRVPMTDHMRRAARRMFDSVPGSKYLHRRQTESAWLTPLSAGYLFDNKTALPPDLERHSALLGLRTSRGCNRETFNASQHTLELRHPYRDRRLVEFVLSLPAYQLYHRGLFKHVLRTAMNDILPEVIRTRRQPTSLLPLYFRGVDREKKLLQDLFQNPDTIWRRFARADWISKRWNVPVTPDQDGPEVLAPWLCISYETWHKSFDISA